MPQQRYLSLTWALASYLVDLVAGQSAFPKSIGAEMVTLEEIESVETTRWVERQLLRMKALVDANGSDPGLVELIDFLLAENDWWSDPDAAAEMSSKGLIDGSNCQAIN